MLGAFYTIPSNSVTRLSLTIIK
ncbi:hypothetical protein EYZ11_012849 [Aspergillus tanneri]|uniref:Uncharacterized protein n=1 Tax=Aspergillus tanneri TaxID=1220188 RepID=A0A4S3IZF5_9EURO|nr:hypothetical protein EYZ11_012849 [Aspergillus tanneri]